MALSDQLSKLAARAKEAEEHAAAAREQDRKQLEEDLNSMDAAAEAQDERMRKMADEAQGKVSAWWTDVQRSWNEQIARMRADRKAHKASFDASRAEDKAELAEDNAQFALDFAYNAVVEADYAVVDATLARMEADQLAGKAAATAQ